MKSAKAKATTAPKMGSKQSAGPQMKGLFGVTPKKPEPDMPVPPKVKPTNAARRARLKGVRL